jgi:hypothetical protein
MNNIHRAKLFFALQDHGLVLSGANVDALAGALSAFEDAVTAGVAHGTVRGNGAAVVVEFPSQAQKEDFIGGLLDGWGEGAPIEVTWDGAAGTTNVWRIRVRDDD